MKKQYKKTDILNMLETNNYAVVKALLVLTKLQTMDEFEFEQTQHKNNVGFNAADGKILTGICKFYINNQFISTKQFQLVKTRIKKYANQLTKIANGEIVVPE